ncbi:carbon storage regulator CsrA [soil metagenome]
MLILSRAPGEAIIIDGGIRIVVVACDRGGVRLGIEAPASITILRSEIVDAIAAENRRASATGAAGEWLSSLAGAPEPSADVSAAPGDGPIDG